MGRGVGMPPMLAAAGSRTIREKPRAGAEDYAATGIDARTVVPALEDSTCMSPP